MDRNIRSEISLSGLIDGKFEVTGITNLRRLKKIGKKEILASRGEFAGYFIENGRVGIFRDRIGGRNIYYNLDGGKVLVSTDLAWIAAKLPAPSPNFDYILNDYMQFQIPFGAETFFKDIKKVLPGEIVWIADNGIVSREKYWDIKFGNESFEPEHLLFLLKDAVNFRIGNITDSKYTAYLSGGLDSSAVSLLSMPKETFSGFYAEEGYSEMDYIESVIEKARKIQRYVKVKIVEKDFYRCVGKLPEILPDPSCGLGVIPQVIVAEQAARAGYDYAFTGEGGDEIFLGYNWNTMILTLADAARKLGRDRYMVRYEGMIDKILEDGMPTLTGGLLSRGDSLYYSTKKILDIWDKSEPVENNILAINLKVGLPAILSVDERVGYFSGVMPVSPIMDHKIVEYVASVKPAERAPIPKFMFREALKDILPEKVRTRFDKMGFPVPYKKWKWPMLEKAMKSLKKRKLLEVNLSEHKTMERKSWAFFNLESWLEKYSGE